MKQILLNILFIVGSALLFIQGAKLLPNGGKIFQQSTTLSNNNSTPGKHSKLTPQATGILNLNTSLKNRVLAPFFKNSSLPDNIMIKINAHRKFYNPYLNLSDYGLFSKYTSEW